MNAKIKSEKIKNRIVELVIKRDVLIDDFNFHEMQVARLAMEVEHHKHAAKFCKGAIEDLKIKIDACQNQINLNKTT